MKMYELKECGCVPYTLNKEEYDWMIGQLRAKRTSELKKAMGEYMDCFGVAELRALVKSVTKEQ
jgi:hypothetical protein